GEIYVLPAQRRDVLQQSVGNIPAPLAQMSRCPAEIDGIPMNDGADHEVEAGSPECLTVKGTITDFATLVEKDGALGRPSRLSEKQKQGVRRDLAKGMSVSAIARKFTTSRQTIRRVRD